MKCKINSLSLAFLFSGTPLVYIFREYVPTGKVLITQVVIVIAVLFIANYRNVFTMRFVNNKPIVFLLFLLFTITLFLVNAILSGELYHSETIFIIITLFLWFGFLSLENDDFIDIVKYIYIFSSLVTICSILFNTEDWVLKGRFYVGDTNNPNLTSYLALINIIFGLYYLYFYNRRQVWVWIMVFAIASCSLYLYLMSFSKSSILGFALVFLFYSYYRGVKLENILKLAGLLLLIGFILVALFPSIGSDLMTKLMHLFDASNSYLTGESGSLSAQIRHENLSNVFSLIKSVTFFTGNGIYTTRADLPALQVLTDLGYMAFIFNIIVMYIFPVCIVLNFLFNVKSYRDCSLSPLYVSVISIYLFYLPNNLFHGTPYEYSIWLPILALYKFTPWVSDN